MAANQITSETPYSAADLEAAYKAVYGAIPASMADFRKEGGQTLFPGYGKSIFPGSVIDTPGGQKIDASQLMYMYQQGKQQAAVQAAGAPAGAAAGAPAGTATGAPAGAQTSATSYLSPSGGPSGPGNMDWNAITSLGYSPQDIATFQQKGWSPA
jgi:hypothetical protein